MPNQDYVHLHLHKKKLGRPPRITESQITDIISSYTRKTDTYEPVFLQDNLMPHFIRGYFDGDGTVYKLGAKSGDYPGHYRFAICVNERTGRFFQSYLEDKGIRCSLVEDKGSSIFQLRIGDTLSKQKFVKLIYSDSQGLCLKRKKRLSDQFMLCCEGLKHEL